MVSGEGQTTCLSDTRHSRRLAVVGVDTSHPSSRELGQLVLDPTTDVRNLLHTSIRATPGTGEVLAGHALDSLVHAGHLLVGLGDRDSGLPGAEHSLVLHYYLLLLDGHLLVGQGVEIGDVLAEVAGVGGRFGEEPIASLFEHFEFSMKSANSSI